MAYTLSIPIVLGAAATGKTLKAQLVDTAGADVGSAVTTGFVEIGKGNYGWTYAAFPDGFRGFVKVYEGTLPAGLLAVAAINPEEAEDALRIRAKTDSLTFSEAGAVDANVTYGDGDPFYVADGTLQAATTTALTLDPSEPATADYYAGRLIELKSGALARAQRRITAYSAARVATLDSALPSAPSAGDTYRIGDLAAAAAGGGVTVDGYADGQDPATLVWAAAARSLTDKAGFALASAERDAVADALLDRAGGVETGETPRQWMRKVRAVLLGVCSADGVFKRKDGTTTSLTVNLDGAGARTSVTDGTN